MQIQNRIRLDQAESKFDKNLADELTRYSTMLAKVLNNGLKFADNFNAQIVSYTSNAIANTEDTIAHTLGRIPTGFLVLNRSKAGVIYQGPSTGTAWTATNIYVKSSVASTVCSILIF